MPGDREGKEKGGVRNGEKLKVRERRKETVENIKHKGEVDTRK